MRLERDHHRLRCPLPRTSHDFIEHTDVGAMHTIKVAYTDQRRPKVSRNFVEFAEDLHQISNSSFIPS